MDLGRLSQKEVAGLLRVVDKTVRNLKDEGIPSHGEGRALYYVWDEVEPWWYERRLRLAGMKKSGDHDIPKFSDSEARKMAADAEMAEMKAETMRGTHVNAAAMEVIYRAHVASAKAKLLAIGPRVSVQLVDGMSVPERRALIDEGVYAACSELEQGDEAEASA
jgi:phage terminase Nu1 subunit (DNA packaging protein)